MTNSEAIRFNRKVKQVYRHPLKETKIFSKRMIENISKKEYLVQLGEYKRFIAISSKIFREELAFK